MINYVIGKEEVKRRVERLKISNKVDLDHQLVVLIRGKKTEDGKVEKSEEKEKRENMGLVGRGEEEFREESENSEIGGTEVNEKINEMRRKLKEIESKIRQKKRKERREGDGGTKSIRKRKRK